MAGLMVIVVIANTVGQIKLNTWLGTFYDTLSERSYMALWEQLTIFLLIVGGLLVLVVLQTWLQETIKIRLREWLTHDLVDEWLAPRRPYLLAHAGESGANPDQYMQADARHLAELSASLAAGLLQSSLLLVSFIGVLWVLSSQVAFVSGDQSFTIPGYMVWCALAYAVAGSLLTWFVGRPLIKLNAERYAREADLRFAIVRINESAEAIALHGGETDERRSVNAPIVDVVTIGRQLANGLAKLAWVTSGYGWLALVVPIIVAAPGYFSGSLTIGGLMMVVGAFNQVQNSLRWFVDNFAGIADWRATLFRVARFRNNLVRLKAERDSADGIAVDLHPDGKLLIDGLSLSLPDGHSELDTPTAEVGHGERVLIQGAPGSGKARLLKALAGLSPKGAGTILLPPPHLIMFLPARPYLAHATLREVVSYPARGENFDDKAVMAALTRVGLARLIARLGEKERWERMLSPDEQQRVALARLLLQEPRWVFIEDVASSMDEQHAALVKSIFSRELSRSAVIGIGAGGRSLTGFYRRTISLQRYLPDGSPDTGVVRPAWSMPRLQAAE